MKTNEPPETRIARVIRELLSDARAVTVRVPGYMKLSLERLDVAADGPRVVAVSHTTTQNGDLMRDPEVVFEIRDTDGEPTARAVSFRNDFLGRLDEVDEVDESGRVVRTNSRLERELLDFAVFWFGNLEAQGFLGTNAERRVLA
jgi:hypothetical protein